MNVTHENQLATKTVSDFDLPVLTIKAGRPVTTSMDVSRVFGKRHADVLRAIQRIDLTAKFIERNFAFNEYVDSIGRKLPYYELTRDGFTFLVMGFTGKEANLWKLRYIEAFNAMEEELLKQTTISPTSSLDALAIAFTKMAEQERAVTRIRQEQENLKNVTHEMKGQIEQIAKRQKDMDGNTGYMTALAFCRLEEINAPLAFAQQLGVRATEMCRRLNIRTGNVPDERWGKVNSYPVSVLHECLMAMQNTPEAV